MEETDYDTRMAYDAVFHREYTYATFKGLTVDQANRHANIQAVKYAWIEYNLMKNN